MEIGNVKQSASQGTASVQTSTTQEADAKAVEHQPVMQKDFQVNLNAGLKAKLIDFANLLQNREQLIQSLPEDVQKAVKKILQQVSAEVDISQGLSSLLTGQKNIVEKLKNMSNLLEFTATLSKTENKDIKAFVQTVIKNVMDQLDMEPEQSAKELLQLAKQLSVTTSVPQSDFKQAVKNYLQEQLPEAMQQLSSSDQKIANQLTKLLAKDVPIELQQFAQNNHLSELPSVWSTLKVVDAWPFKDVQPKTLQAAADLLNQMAEEFSSENTTMTGQLAEFVKNLPTEVGSKTAMVSQSDKFMKNLLADVGSKAVVAARLEEFVKSLPADVSSKVAVALQVEKFIKSLPVDVGSKAAVTAQLEEFVKSLPADVSSKVAVALQVEKFMKSLLADVGSKAAVTARLEEFVKSLPADVSSKVAVALQVEKFLKSLPANVGNKAAVATQLEEFVKSLPADVSSKVAVALQVEKFIKSLPVDVGSKAAVTAQLEEFVKNLPADVSSKVAVASQIEKFVKNLPVDAGSKAVVAQLEEFVKNLPNDISSKTAVPAQVEKFMNPSPTRVSNQSTSVTGFEVFAKTLPGEFSEQTVINAKLEQFLETLPPEISKALQEVLKQENIPTNLRDLADTFSQAALLNEHRTSEQEVFSLNLVENFAGKAPSIPTEIRSMLTQLATKFSDTATILEDIKVLVDQLKTQLLTGDPQTLEKEYKSLEKLTKLFADNIPQSLQEGAIRHKLTDLPKVWVLLKSLETEAWENTETENLQKSATMVKELAQSIYKSIGATGEKQVEHSILSFSVPLQVAEGMYYPAHIHIYHQEEDKKAKQVSERQFETWLRICVDTENIGMVDSVFRLYGENKLDVRVNFPSTLAAYEFSQNVPNIIKKLDESPLDLTEIMVNHGLH